MLVKRGKNNPGAGCYKNGEQVQLDEMTKHPQTQPQVILSY